MFVPVPIVFKGSGFYVTDHRDAGKSSAVDSAKPATPKPVVPETKSSGESAKDKAPVSQKETAGSAKA